MHNQVIRIRKATLNDLSDVQFCARTAYAKYIDRIGKEPAPINADFADQIARGFVDLALYRTRFAGYVVFYPDGNDLYLENVAVLPEFRGRGIGRALIKHVENAARKQELQAIRLYTNEAMTENLGMYPRLGYVETGRKTQDGFRRVFFRKVLDASTIDKGNKKRT